MNNNIIETDFYEITEPCPDNNRSGFYHLSAFLKRSFARKARRTELPYENRVALQQGALEILSEYSYPKLDLRSFPTYIFERCGRGNKKNKGRILFNHLLISCRVPNKRHSFSLEAIPFDLANLDNKSIQLVRYRAFDVKDFQHANLLIELWMRCMDTVKTYMTSSYT